MDKIIRANLSYWMSFSGLSHKQTAKAMSISSATLYSRLREPSSFSVAELEKFAKEIGIDIVDLMIRKV